MRFMKNFEQTHWASIEEDPSTLKEAAGSYETLVCMYYITQQDIA
jgi:hypothetical protein